MAILVTSDFISWLRFGMSRLVRMFLYPWRRMGLIHVSKTLLKMPWVSSGPCWLLSTLDSGRFVQHSSAKSTEYTVKRRNTGREVGDSSSATVEERVKCATSHNRDARRYIVARSEGLRDRRCSWIERRLRPKLASMDANNEAMKSVLCSTSTLKTLVKYEDNMVDSNKPRA